MSVKSSTEAIPFNSTTKITKHIWSIHKNSIQKFKSLPTTSHTQSDEFHSHSFPNIKWYLRAYPNGTNAYSKDSCKVFLRLTKCPNTYKSIKIYYFIRCIQTDSCIENVNEFTKNNDFSGWSSRAQLSKELLNANVITFECGIRVLKITDTHNQTMYSYPLSHTSIARQTHLQWNINNKLLNTFKHSQYGKWCNATLLSETNHLFSIACCPNGDGEKDKGYFSLFVICVSFPQKVQSIKVKFSLHCPKLGVSKTEMYVFSEKKSSRGWPRFCTQNKLMKVSGFEVICNAEILEMYDANNDIIMFGIQTNNSSFEYQKSEEKKENRSHNQPILKRKQTLRYNNEIITELVNLGVGTREECMAASSMVINTNDINEIKDKISEIQNAPPSFNPTLNPSIKSTTIESVISTHKYRPRQSIAEPFSPKSFSPSTANKTDNDTIRSSIKGSFSKETKVFKYTWTINPLDLNKFRSLQLGHYTQSNLFMTDSYMNLKWLLRCYPNGMNKSSINSCKMYLCLSQLSNKYKSIAIYYYIRCPQTHSCTEFIREFTKSGDNSGWKTRRQLSNELQKTTQISFETGIRILKITDIHNNIVYRYPLLLSLITRRFKLKWHINFVLLNAFRNAHFGKSIDAILISQKNPMFSIQCYPNGFGESDKGYLSLYFIVVSFPIGVEAMKVKFTLKVAKLTYIKQYIFSQQKYGRGWDKFAVAKSIFSNIKTLDIVCDIEIVELYNKSNDKIPFGHAKGGTVSDKMVRYEDKIASLQNELYKYKKLMKSKTEMVQSLQNNMSKHTNDKKKLQKRFDEITQANTRQRSTIQRRKTLTETHQQINQQLRAQIATKDEDIKALKAKLNKSKGRVSDDEEKKNILTDLNGNIELFQQNFNKQKVKVFLDKSLKDLIANVNENGYKNDIQNLKELFERFEKYSKNMQMFVKGLSTPNVNGYKKWDLLQIMAWIISLENGKYVKYIQKLWKGFEDSQIDSGNVLPEMTRTDLSNPPFGINEFSIKRDLEKHFQSLAITSEDSDRGNEGAQFQ